MAEWNDLTFGYKSRLLSTQMQMLDENFDALAEGAPGAPSVQAAAVNSGAIRDWHIADGAIGGNQLYLPQGPVVQSLAAGASWYPDAGAYILGTSYSHQNYIVVEIQDKDGTWQSTGAKWGFYICDGTDVRVRNTDGSNARWFCYYHFNS